MLKEISISDIPNIKIGHAKITKMQPVALSLSAKKELELALM